LPLAIELAAARLRMMTPRRLADRLDDRFRLLTSGSRTVLPRQQTLRAVVDWSWDLLDEPERTVLRELSVFAGGWDLEAAEAVCSGPVAELVGALVDKSLVVAAPDARGGGMRYRMLETIHEYADERAAEVPALRARAERRHRAWARSLAERADPLLRSAGQLPWIARLETELDNIRAATDRALAAGAEEEAGALCLAMGWFWWLRNYRHEGAGWVDRSLRLGAALDALGVDPTSGPGPGSREVAELPALASGIDPVDAFLAHADGEEGHPRHAQRMNLRMLHVFLLSEAGEEALSRDPRRQRFVGRLRAWFERGGPYAARMPGLVWPVTLFQHGGTTDLDRAEVLGILDQAVATCRAHGGEWELACALMFRTHMVVDSPGGLLGVDEDLAELRDLARRVGDRWVRAQVSSAVGEAAMARGRSAEAESAYREALRLAHEVGAHTETPFLLARLAEIAYRAGDVGAARTSLDEASESADRHGVADARAFVLLLRANIALDEEDTARARELCTEVRRVCGEG
ncbi:ATP-binding protein, partial [Streptomyces albogriseolus]|uniref:ATP-binding protein n=1 Tax=Streptomyces albogriseolus TaxID=1887 RepID=UPI0036FF6E8E